MEDKGDHPYLEHVQTKMGIVQSRLCHSSPHPHATSQSQPNFQHSRKNLPIALINVSILWLNCGDHLTMCGTTNGRLVSIDILMIKSQLVWFTDMNRRSHNRMIFSRDDIFVHNKDNEQFRIFCLYSKLMSRRHIKKKKLFTCKNSNSLRLQIYHILKWSRINKKWARFGLIHFHP